MAIIARASNTPGGGDFVPAPVGLHRAVCADVIDLGIITTQYGSKHKVAIIWQTEALMPDGKPYLVSQRYTLSLDERANLRRDLESWRGKKFSLTEAAGFDLERLVGVQCALVIVHKQGTREDKVFANVASVLPCPPGAKLQIRDYVRVTQRPGYQPPAGQPAHPPVGPSYPTPGRAVETERAAAVTRPMQWPRRQPQAAPAPTPPPHVADAPPPTDDPFGDAQTAQAPDPITADDIPFVWVLPILPALYALQGVMA